VKWNQKWNLFSLLRFLTFTEKYNEPGRELSVQISADLPPNLDISKSWYIKFKIWHHGQGELVTRRIMGNINRIHNKEERYRAAKAVRDEVNALLKEGWTIGQKETVKT
jgi:hypothetical protein